MADFEVIRLVLVPHSTKLAREVDCGVVHYIKVDTSTNGALDVYCGARQLDPVELIERDHHTVTCVRCKGLYG